jgi:hypothetical protein
MPKPLIIVLSVVIIALGGLGTWWFLSAQPNEPAETTGSSTSTTQTPPPASTAEEPVTGVLIVFTDSGFERQNYTVPSGETVTVKNESSMVVEFSSDEHPTHTDNPELNMDALQPGQQDTFTPTRTGEWGIHDHEHPEFTTTLTVIN